MGQLMTSEMALEEQIYRHLGSHPRLVEVHGWDPIEYMLTLEYMPNGALKDYMESHELLSVPETTRRKWISQAAEGLQYLHSRDVYHFDFKPKNLLLDSSLDLKVADFACSSFQGCEPTGCAGLRYMPPDGEEDGLRADIFALGSTIYAISTWHDPFGDVDSDKVSIPDLFREGKIPDLGGLAYSDVIRACWENKYPSVQAVWKDVQGLEALQKRRGYGALWTWLCRSFGAFWSRLDRGCYGFWSWLTTRLVLRRQS